MSHSFYTIDANKENHTVTRVPTYQTTYRRDVTLSELAIFSSNNLIPVPHPMPIHD